MNPWLTFALGWLAGTAGAFVALRIGGSQLDAAREDGYRAGVKDTLAVAVKARTVPPAELFDADRHRRKA